MMHFGEWVPFIIFFMVTRNSCIYFAQMHYSYNNSNYYKGNRLNPCELIITFMIILLKNNKIRVAEIKKCKKDMNLSFHNIMLSSLKYVDVNKMV